MSAEMYEDDMGGRGRGMVTRKRLSGKKLVAFVVLPLVGVAVVVGALAYLGVIDKLTKKSAPVEQAASAPGVKGLPPTYLPLPDMLVNLRSDSPRPSFLKISIELELASPDDKARLEKVLPRVLDSFQTALREMRVTDLQGAQGMDRVREELRKRVNDAGREVNVSVNDVLFKEMLVQ
jgi:flagellar FliL protein